MTPPDEQKTLRLFYAVALSEEARAAAAAHAAALREHSPPRLKVSWERAGKMHVTLKFIGDVAAEHVERLTRAALRAALREATLTLSLEGCGVFPSRSRPHVLWLGIAGETEKLAALQLALEAECARENFPRESRPFHPHVTLARLRAADADARRLAALHLERGFEPIGFPVAEFALMRSELGAGGSAYTALARFGLRGEVRG